MRINIFRLKTWMLIHMILMNLFLICIIPNLAFQFVMAIIIIYFLASITENKFQHDLLRGKGEQDE
jgi:hypothetical protein